MSTAPKSFLTLEQYLSQERQAAFKSEYYRGETCAMAGASRKHNLIVANVVGEMRQSLKDRMCEVYPSDMRVKANPSGLYTYPDVVIVCGEPNFEDDEFDTLLNPTLIIEVVSESTESYDRGAKSALYRESSSLREYVLIAQDRVSIECLVRQSDDRWLLNETRPGEMDAKFASLGISIPVTEIYRNIRFDEN